MRLRDICALVGLSLAVATPASAQVEIDSPVTVNVRHVTRKIQVGQGDRVDLLAKTTLRQSYERRVSLVVEDRNPYLFSYEAKTAETENEQHKIIAGFAEQLAALAKAFGAAGGAK